MLGLLFIFALCLVPYYLLLAPWVVWQAGVMGLDVLHTFSLELLSLNSCLDLLIYCFSVPNFPQDSWVLSCHREWGEKGMKGKPPPWPPCLLHPGHPPRGTLARESSLEEPRFSF